MSGVGMYTELCVAFNLVADTPQQVIDTLQWMTGTTTGNQPPSIPDAPLFTSPRWSHMLQGGSYYFDGGTHSAVEWDDNAEVWSVDFRCNLKNYESEIDKLLNWLLPHIELEHVDWQYVGTKRYESDDLPTLIIVRPEPRSILFVDLCRTDVLPSIANQLST